MTDGQFRFFCNIIRTKFDKDYVEIHTPEIPGSLDNVLIAHSDTGDEVFKFGNEHTIKKNAQASRLYNTVKKIPVPTVTAHEHNGVHFERYKMIEGQTLYNMVNTRQLRPDQIKQIYRDIVAEFAKMVRTPPILLNNNQDFYFHKFAREHTANANNETLAKIFMCLAYIANAGADKDKAVIHSDLSPKNTIITPDGKLAGFIDMDSIVICDKNYAFCAMASWYKNMGFDIAELMDYYEKISNDKLNRARVSAMVNINNFGKKMLWLHKQRKK